MFKRLHKALLLVTLGLSLAAFSPQAFASKVQPLPKNSYQYKAMVLKEARTYWGPEANVALFAAQFHQESAWNNNAVSYVGAKGLGQFMPGTAKEVHARYKDLAVLPIYSPLWSVKALFLYDRQLYNAIKPLQRKEPLHPCTHYAMMLSSYNGGLGWLNRDRRLTIQRGDDPDIWWGNVEKHSNRAGWAIKENRDYPVRIMLRHTQLYLSHGYPGVDVCKTEPKQASPGVSQKSQPVLAQQSFKPGLLSGLQSWVWYQP